MTWEWVALILGCLALTTVFAQKLYFEVFVNAEEVEKLSQRMLEMQTQINELYSSRFTTEKLAEETKKMLSEANLAKGLRVQR